MDRDPWLRQASGSRRQSRLTSRGRATLFSLAALPLLAAMASVPAPEASPPMDAFRFEPTPGPLPAPAIALETPPVEAPEVVAAAPVPHPFALLPEPSAPPGLLGRVPVFSEERVAAFAESGATLSETLPVSQIAREAPEPAGLGPSPMPGLLPPDIDRLRVEYAFDTQLMRRVNRVLRRDRAPRAHVVVMDVQSGRVLAFASSDPERLPPNRAYPAASLVKIVTAAGAIEHAPSLARRPCRYSGSPWRLTRSRLDPPTKGKQASLERALATSNNQCFAQMAVHALGAQRMLDQVRRFGWLDAPAPGHEVGRAAAGEDAWELGKLGSGLGGSHITPLHAVQLAASLAHGEIVEPWWVERVVDERGRALRMPQRGERQRAMSARHAEELRQMLVTTTTRGTARRGFRFRDGRPKLGALRVAGKTGNLSGRVEGLPRGRFEWFAGVAPAEEPRVAIAVLQLHDNLWWATSSQVAADVLREIFCEDGHCDAGLVGRFGDPMQLAMRGPARTASLP